MERFGDAQGIGSTDVYDGSGGADNSGLARKMDGAGDWGGFCRPIRNGLGDAAKFSAVHHVVRFTGLVLDDVPELIDFVLRMQVQCESAGVFVVPRLAPGAPEPETTEV